MALLSIGPFTYYMNTSFQHFTFTLLTGGTIKVQLRAKQTAHLVNKHYQNEVTLTGQNPPLQCCQPLEILTHFITSLDLSMLEIWGL